MKPSTENSAVDGSSAARWLGRLWLGLLAAGVVVLEYRLTPRDALDLGEENFGIAVFLGLPFLILLILTLIAWLASGVARLVRRKPQKWEPWLRIGILALVFVGIAGKRSAHPPINPISPESELVYLKIAETAREELEKPGGDSYLPLDPKIAHAEREMRHASRARLDEMVPAYWPRSMLYILGCVS